MISLHRKAGDTCLATPSSTPGAALRIGVFIDRLNYGGAERQLVILADALRRNGHHVVVLVFYAGGELEADLRQRGVRVCVLGKRGRWDVLRFGIRLLRVLREERLDVVHGYAGVPNLLSVVMKPILPGMKVIWGIRASNMQLSAYGWLPPVLDRVAAALSRYPDLVVANSVAGLAHAQSHGYAPRRAVVIPNGIDTNRFAPCAEARERVRSQWGVHAGEKVIGLVARLDPMKGHETFLRAAALLAGRRDRLRFLCIGNGPADFRSRLQQIARQCGVERAVQWIPAQHCIAEAYNGLDILCSASSYGEGFPNVVGEAMACGVPCVVTDVGDSGRVLGRPELTVPPGDAEALADRIDRLLNTSSDGLRRMAYEGRQRIRSEFSVEQLAGATEVALHGLFSASAARTGPAGA